jgi:hypothetical protein
MEAWENLYNSRSEIFHGESYFDQEGLWAIAIESRRVCHKVVDTYIRHQLGD